MLALCSSSGCVTFEQHQELQELLGSPFVNKGVEMFYLHVPTLREDLEGCWAAYTTTQRAGITAMNTG